VNFLLVLVLVLHCIGVGAKSDPDNWQQYSPRWPHLPVANKNKNTIINAHSLFVLALFTDQLIP